MKNCRRINCEDLYTALDMLDKEIPENKVKFSTEELLRISSMCCITPDDQVLLATQELTKLLLIISYFYIPYGASI